MAKHLVQWNRPERDRYDLLVYRSKCGRFTITKRSYNLPTRSVGYALTVDGVRRAQEDSLQAAKERADWVLDPNWDIDLGRSGDVRRVSRRSGRSRRRH
jgi:hypothetical protein